MTGRIHSVFSGGTVDGPGIRFVVFMQGCPLRCKYCHNPDTWLYSGGEERTAVDLVNEIIKYKNYFGTKGGVTISGGEPLLQIDFVIELLKLCKSYGIHTAIDTSGYMFDINNAESVAKHQELINYVDLFLLDIKHVEEKGHKDLTGVSNKNTLNFAKWLDEKGKKMWIRQVLLDGYTTDEGQLTKLADFIKGLANVEKIELLPYHTMGVVKYKNLGLNYSLDGVEPPTKDKILKAREILGVLK